MDSAEIIGQVLTKPEDQICPTFIGGIDPTDLPDQSTCALSYILSEHGVDGSLDTSLEVLRQPSMVGLPIPDEDEIQEKLVLRLAVIAQLGSRCAGCKLAGPIVNAYSNK